jgi:hypothetical protein
MENFPGKMENFPGKQGKLPNGYEHKGPPVQRQVLRKRSEK